MSKVSELLASSPSPAVSGEVFEPLAAEPPVQLGSLHASGSAAHRLGPFRYDATHRSVVHNPVPQFCTDMWQRTEGRAHVGNHRHILRRWRFAGDGLCADGLADFNSRFGFAPGADARVLCPPTLGAPQRLPHSPLADSLGASALAYTNPSCRPSSRAPVDKLPA
jgi:hypothetical protein